MMMCCAGHGEEWLVMVMMNARMYLMLEWMVAGWAQWLNDLMDGYYGWKMSNDNLPVQPLPPTHLLIILIFSCCIIFICHAPLFILADYECFAMVMASIWSGNFLFHIITHDLIQYIRCRRNQNRFICSPSRTAPHSMAYLYLLQILFNMDVDVYKADYDIIFIISN